MAPNHALQSRPQWAVVQALRGLFEFPEGPVRQGPARYLDRPGELQMGHDPHAQVLDIAGFGQGLY